MIYLDHERALASEVLANEVSKFIRAKRVLAGDSLLTSESTPGEWKNGGCGNARKGVSVLF